MRRAFTLIEMLATLSLLAVFLLVSARLFHSTFRTIRTTGQAQDAASQFERAIQELRRDVWSARSMEAQEGTLVLQEGGRTVTWSAQPGGGLSRAVAGGPAVVSSRRWEGIPAKMGFKVEGAALGVVVKEKAGEDTIAMVSQGMLLGRGGAQ